MKNYEHIIYKLYKEFYEKEPNLCKDNLINITIEIQSMVYLLRKYGIDFYGRFALGYYKNLDLPMDIKLQDVIVQKMINKDINSFDESVQFDYEVNEFIDIIGSKIREIMDNSENPIEALRMATYILYSREFVYPSASDEEIIEYMNCTKEDLGIVRTLTKDYPNNYNGRFYANYKKSSESNWMV